MTLTTAVNAVLLVGVLVGLAYAIYRLPKTKSGFVVLIPLLVVVVFLAASLAMFPFAVSRDGSVDGSVEMAPLGD